jgi:hypothetical protein
MCRLRTVLTGAAIALAVLAFPSRANENDSATIEGATARPVWHEVRLPVRAMLTSLEVGVPASQFSVRPRAVPRDQESETIGSQRLIIADRCGASGLSCSNPYPYCCWSQSRGYYCATDISHC